MSTYNKAKRVIERLIGESGSDNSKLTQVTQDLADILNRYQGDDIEDTSHYPGVMDPRADDYMDQHNAYVKANPDWDKNPNYDTTGQSEGLALFRGEILGWIKSARNLLATNDEAQKALDHIGWSVRHHMRHETRDCLYNISEPWAEFLRNDKTGPQLRLQRGGFGPYVVSPGSM